MVQVSLTALVKVAGGPTWSMASTFTPESYTVASVALDAAAGGTPAEEEVPLLPDDGTVTVLAIRARGAAGADAEVTVMPSNGGTDGDELTVSGTLVVANVGVLSALVSGGPRKLTVKNAAADPVTVDVLTCLDFA
jgi:hypothetical protein